MFKKVLLVAAVLGLSGSAMGVAQAGGRPAKAAPVSGWQQGIRAGTIMFGKAPGATCKPVVGTVASDRKCKITMNGKFVAKDRGYQGTYTGSAIVNYLDPVASSSAAFESGSVTYTIKNMQGVLLKKITLSIDLGTGGVYGFPYDLSQTYWFEERTDVEPGIVLRMEGVSVNQLDANLNPTHTFIDRQSYY
ncbi:MAG: hypothetical protein HZB15_11920 [Actinobacteria bacterium]|nr:hypothetical protein [Actinomycetota bacterium]